MTTSEYPMRNVNLPPTEDSGSSSTVDEISPSIDDAMLMGNVWNRYLTHQTRVLLYVEPLLRVLSSDENRSEELAHYDSLALSLKLLDHIVTHTGLEHEADSEIVMRELLPLMDAMDQSAGIEPDIERQMRMAKIVLSALRNDKEGLRSFKRAYTDFTSEHAVKRELCHTAH